MALESESRITANWKNVNNWHWVDKDCTPWCVSFVKKQLEGLKVEKDNLCGVVNSITSVKGDSVVNQRRGKFTCVFDLEIQGTWTLESKKKGGEVIKGNFEIEEFAYDTDIPNIEVKFNTDDESKLDAEYEKFLKGELTNAIGKNLEDFVEKTIEANRKDVFVQDTDKKHIKRGENGKPLSEGEEGDDSEENGNPSMVSHKVSFSASPMDLFDCLTNIDRVQAWSRCVAELTATPGGAFSLLNGKISGIFKELIPGEKIVQSWRLNSWDDGRFSEVTISIKPDVNGSKLLMTQSSVPKEHKPFMNENWARFYWWPIRDTFGFGCNLE